MTNYTTLPPISYVCAIGCAADEDVPVGVVSVRDNEGSVAWMNEGGVITDFAAAGGTKLLYFTQTFECHHSLM